MTDETTQIPTTRSPERFRKSTRGFSIAIAASLVLHGVGVASAIAKSRVRHDSRIESSIPVELVKLGKKRDPKLLPRAVADPPPPPEEAIALDSGKRDKETPAPKTKPTETKAKDPELSSAARRMLEQNQLDRALSKIEEPEGDPEGDPRGTTTDRSRAAQGYQREIGRVLQANYKLPEAIPASQRQFLKARVLLFIEKSGRILRYEFVEAHPNTLFMGALESLLKTITLPAPPASEAKSLRETGVEVIFHP